jgi:hypothetical protein
LTIEPDTREKGAIFFQEGLGARSKLDALEPVRLVKQRPLEQTVQIPDHGFSERGITGLAAGEALLGFFGEVADEIFRQWIRRSLELRLKARRVDKRFSIEEGGTAAAAFLDAIPQTEEQPIHRTHQASDNVRLLKRVRESDFLRTTHEFGEERRIILRAAIVLGADVVEVRAVGQRVLRDEIHIATVEVAVHEVPLARRNEALGKNHVGRVEASGVGAAVQNRVTIHQGVKRLVGLWILERRREHVVSEPVAEVVAALLVVSPM